MSKPTQRHIILRQAQIEDAAAIYRIKAEGWKYAYKNILSALFLAQKTSTEEIQAKIDDFAEHLQKGLNRGDIFIVAAEAKKVVGFISGGFIKSPECQADKELHSLYIDVNYIGQGIGKMLIQEFARQMQNLDAKSFGLMCFSENKSIGFYQKMGGKITVERPSGAKFEYKMGAFLEFTITDVLKK